MIRFVRLLEMPALWFTRSLWAIALMSLLVGLVLLLELPIFPMGEVADVGAESESEIRRSWGWPLIGVGLLSALLVAAFRFRTWLADRRGNPQARLADVLLSSKILLERPENNFEWSSWRDSCHAAQDIDGLLARLQRGDLPAYAQLSTLFASSGSMQEVSVSSGWAREFLTLADRFDTLSERLWPDASA
jgi:hypothetical protein